MQTHKNTGLFVKVLTWRVQAYVIILKILQKVQWQPTHMILAVTFMEHDLQSFAYNCLVKSINPEQKISSVKSLLQFEKTLSNILSVTKNYIIPYDLEDKRIKLANWKVDLWQNFT